jgi:hypothetical protein
MNTTRFAYPNKAVGPTASVVLTPSEDPNFPASNVVIRDRYVKWSCPVTADQSIVIDLGGVQAIRVIGLLGLVRDPSVANGLGPSYLQATHSLTYPDPVFSSLSTTSGLSFIDRSSGTFLPNAKVGQRITSATTGIPTGATITAVSPTRLTINSPCTATISGTGTITLSDTTVLTGLNMPAEQADHYYLLNAPANMRYIKFDFAFVFGAFSVGSFLAAPLVDLGISFSAGSGETIMRSVTRVTRADMVTRSTEVGPDRVRLAYQFQNIPASVKDKLFAALTDTPVCIITPGDKLYEVVTADDAIGSQMVWGSPELYNVVADMETLP